MSLPKSAVRYTVEEYLAWEREADERHEYLDGEICAMAGESENHNTICVNLARELSLQLKGTPGQTFAKDMKVRSGPDPKPFGSLKNFFSYPDLIVVGGERRYHDEHRDVLLNPQVIIEVLSLSTEAFDRGEKFIRFRTWNPTLTDYVLVSQTAPYVEHYRRQTQEAWLLSPVAELEGRLHLVSIDCTLALSEVYDRVAFPVDEPGAVPPEG